jgi:hypothetical protein
VAAAEAFKNKGVDTVACIYVNDPFVMGAWGKDQKTDEKVTMLGDGNGAFTQAMGLTMDGSKFGLGTRSQRYAMIVRDGIIKELFVEKPGAFEVSTAENVLNHLQVPRKNQVARSAELHHEHQGLVASDAFPDPPGPCSLRDGHAAGDRERPVARRQHGGLRRHRLRHSCRRRPCRRRATSAPTAPALTSDGACASISVIAKAAGACMVAQTANWGEP